MALDYPAARERVHARYPFYRSSKAERDALFGASSNPNAAEQTEVTWGKVA